MNTICINGRFLAAPVTGVQRYARELLREMDIILSEGEHEHLAFVLLVPPDAAELPPYKFIRIRRVGRRRGHVWEQLELPHFCEGNLLFTPCGGAPLSYSRHVITIHDAAVWAAPEGYSFAYRTWYRALHGLLARKAKHILTVSEFSKAELTHWAKVAEEKITVTYLGGEHVNRLQADETVFARHGLDRNGYVLAVGSQNPNKNLSSLASAMKFLKDIRCPLVVAGGRAGGVFGEVVDVEGDIKRIGYVKDEELRALYQHAACFVFPSKYEGFGLPPLEAAFLGCPIVVSGQGSLMEIFEGIALFVDPLDPRDIANQIRNALAGAVLGRDEIRRRATKYNWRSCAGKTLDILKKLGKPCEE